MKTKQSIKPKSELIRFASKPGWQAPVCLANVSCGLSPRARQQETLNHIRRTMAPTERVAFLLLDIDRFKSVRDLCGPTGSDRVLEVVALERLGTLPNVSTLHLSGDMFVCLTPFSGDTETITSFAQEVQQSLGEPIWVDRNVVHLTVSIGIAIDDDAAKSADDLLHAASIALSNSREDKAGGISQYRPAMLVDLGLRAELEYDFRSGLSRGEIQPYFQPIIDLKGGTVKGFEALARWHHPRRGLIQPDSFLKIADECGLDRDLLFLIVRQACRDARDWPPHLTISVNITPSQLCDPDIASAILQIVFASGLAPDRLIVEITEEALMRNVEKARQTVQSLRRAGIRIALDDFGSGYASLQRLCSLDIDHLKIDKTLIQALDSETGRKMVKAVVELGSTLSMPVTAEGIETSEQAQFMVDAKCAYGQGYLFGRPAPADVARVIVEEGRATG